MVPKNSIAGRNKIEKKLKLLDAVSTLFQGMAIGYNEFLRFIGEWANLNWGSVLSVGLNQKTETYWYDQCIYFKTLVSPRLAKGRAMSANMFSYLA